MNGELTTTVEKNGTVLPREAFGSSAQLSLAEICQLGEIFHKSGAWPDARNAAMCIVKIMAGREMGFPAFASMSNVHIIEGKPSVGAHLMAAAIKRSDRYDFDTAERSREACELVFYERMLMTGGEVRKGVPGWVKKAQNIRMTFKEAVDSGLAVGKENRIKSNWSRTPDAMLFARCVTAGYRTHCPDLSSGVLAYDPDELDPPAFTAMPPAEDSPAQPGTTVAGEHLGSRHRIAELPAATSATPAPPTINTIQMARIDELTELVGVSQKAFRNRVKTLYGADDPMRISGTQADDLIEKLEAALKAKATV